MSEWKKNKPPVPLGRTQEQEFAARRKASLIWSGMLDKARLDFSRLPMDEQLAFIDARYDRADPWHALVHWQLWVWSNGL